MIGHILGHYRIVELLGSGGMGVVYRARDLTLDRDVALKLLRPHALDDEPARSRFMREARALSQLNHPHVCTIHEIGEARGTTFIAMEFVQGQPLSAAIPRDGLPVETIIRYGSQIADAIGHAHQHGIVHRDLKSANIVVTPERQVKVLDFGVARSITGGRPDGGETRLDVTQPGMVMGTPGYIAPEVLAGRTADARSDIWALGVILHEMASGSPPFTGESPVELASSVLKDLPAALPARVAPMLRRIIQRCLAKDPSERYQTAAEVCAALHAVGSEPPARDAPTPSRRTRRMPWLAAGALAIAVIATTGLLVSNADWFTTSDDTPIRSVAVLPLHNLSGDPEQEYFADGMTEQLTGDLSSIARLRVISRTSAMQYKQARKPLPVIARELNVDAIVEGSVIHAGGKVRIIARLIRAAGEERCGPAATSAISMTCCLWRARWPGVSPGKSTSP